MIGVGITTHNRRAMFLEMLDGWLSHCPDDFRIVVVDDGSDVPLPAIDRVTVVRHEVAQGIAASKNAALRALQGCEHVFLADDDLTPVADGWWGPYCVSRHKHLCLTFEFATDGRRISHDIWRTGSVGDADVYTSPNGCLLYMTREVIDTVGGYDEHSFPVCGAEHRDFSSRVFHAGLTQCEFMDVPGSEGLFRILDREGGESSMSEATRQAHYGPNTHAYQLLRGRSTHIPL